MGVAPRSTPDPVLVGLITLATYRLSRLLTVDTLTEGWREAVFDRWPPDAERAARRWNGQRLVTRATGSPQPNPSLLGQVLACPWCAAVWCAAAITTATAAFTPVPLPALTFAAAASAAGFLGALDGALA
jgi:hypothetical protein